MDSILFFGKKNEKVKILEIFWDFWGFLDICPFLTFFLIFGFIMGFLFYFIIGFFLDFFLNFLDFFWIFFQIFFSFFWFFFPIFRFFEIFWFIWDFFLGGGIPFKVTKVTTKSYQGYYWTPKIAKNGPNSIISSFFALGQKKPPPKPSTAARSRPL